MERKSELMWQFCKDPNDINAAIKKRDPNWEGLVSADQIITIIWNQSHSCYMVFWRMYECRESDYPGQIEEMEVITI